MARCYAGPPTKHGRYHPRNAPDCTFAADAAPGLLEFNADRVVAVLVDVLDTMRALGFHPPDAHAGFGSGAWLGLEQHRACLVVPDPGRLVHDHYAGRLVGVLGLACSWLDHHLQH